jgi:hypothetical protein
MHAAVCKVLQTILGEEKVSAGPAGEEATAWYEVQAANGLGAEEAEVVMKQGGVGHCETLSG